MGAEVEVGAQAEVGFDLRVEERMCLRPRMPSVATMLRNTATHNTELALKQHCLACGVDYDPPPAEEGVLPERAMSPLRHSGAAVAPSFAWDGGRSEAMRWVIGGEGNKARI
ncbi:hypothetical protein T492DRAFT_876423 [Pavlovales sp. CCMP2436]|nr:hypothetical protein T492DRAFT_876423 [Pavlovales sp. CCMP2436]